MNKLTEESIIDVLQNEVEYLTQTWRHTTSDDAEAIALIVLRDSLERIVGRLKG